MAKPWGRGEGYTLAGAPARIVPKPAFDPLRTIVA